MDGQLYLDFRQNPNGIRSLNIALVEEDESPAASINSTITGNYKLKRKGFKNSKVFIPPVPIHVPDGKTLQLKVENLVVPNVVANISATKMNNQLIVFNITMN